MARKEVPEINASSMADIAFLLLTFFLIATSMDKPEGIIRNLPDPSKPDVPPVEIHEKDAMKILANSMGQIQIEGEDAQLADIKRRVKEHVDNGGGRAGRDDSGEMCDYCTGKRDPNMSDHPKDAVISIELDRGTPYRVYITVQNEIDRAINELRDQYTRKYMDISYAELKKLAAKEDKDSPGQYTAKLKDVEEEKYPSIIAEAKPKDYSK
ncbi:MAG: biopolymer transporter ExbD [Flavobacteriales bacterium]|nr:biopolymer transporter ExbD [Flavobacteriales bacterium]